MRDYLGLFVGLEEECTEEQPVLPEVPEESPVGSGEELRD